MYCPGSPDTFPSMWQKPACADVLACLEALRLQPDDHVVWNGSADIETHHQRSAASALHARRGASGVARYLDSIVMCDLAWMPDEADRERLWTLASQRIAERCGRAAMGEITRRWPLSFSSSSASSSTGTTSRSSTGTSTPASDCGPAEVSLVLCEPALVGDALGFKTWGAAYVLARLLPALAERPDLLSLLADANTPVLELGAGTGLLGLAAAVLWAADVVLTDLPAIVPNLAANVARNAGVVARSGGQARAAVLTWGDDDNSLDPHTFGIVLAADPLYDDAHPALLAGAVDDHLDRDPAARAVVMVPLRDRHTETLAASFVAAMAARGLTTVDEDRVLGQDSDWGDDDGQTFSCQWWIFGRRPDA